MKVEIIVDDEAHAKLTSAGYVPILRWAKANTICSEGEALKNIEIEAKRARCKHTRNGPADHCRHCGAIMPWAESSSISEKKTMKAR